MRKFDPIDVYGLGYLINIRGINVGDTVAQHSGLLATAIAILSTFASDKSNQEELPRAVDRANECVNHFKAALTEPEHVLTELSLMLIKEPFNNFEIALIDDSSRRVTLAVQRKRGYLTEVLWTEAELNLSADVLPFLAETMIEDIQESGRCLLLDRFTAAGFHILRAVEAVARRYYELVLGRQAWKLNRYGEEGPFTLGWIAADLKKHQEICGQSRKPSGLLDEVQLNVTRMMKGYRNPIMHPEVTLDETRALRVFSLAIEGITDMIHDSLDGGAHFALPLERLGFQI